MKRDPEKHYIKKKMDTIRVKKIYPRFFYYPCEKCGFEYKKENMYQCDWEDSRLILSYTRYGRSHCFDSETQFVKYLQDNGILYNEESLKRAYRGLE